MNRQQPERAEQKAILDLLALVHAEVWVLGTTRKCGDWPGTMHTPGMCDIWAFVHDPTRSSVREPSDLIVAIEVKAPGGRLSPAQQRFRAACERAGVEHLVGGVDAVLAWLYAHGHRVLLNC